MMTEESGQSSQLTVAGNCQPSTVSRVSLLPSALSAVKQAWRFLQIWIERHWIRVSSPKPEKFIFMVANRNGWAAYLIPRNIPTRTAVKGVIFELAMQTDLVVALVCPRKDLAAALKRKYIYSQWN